MKVRGIFDVREGQPGYARFQKHGGHDSKWTVRLNGEERRGVVACDTWVGWALVNLEDENGRPHLNDFGGIARGMLRGDVEVDVRPRLAELG